MGGVLGATVLVINILEVPRLGAGTVSAVLVSSLVIFVHPPVVTCPLVCWGFWSWGGFGLRGLGHRLMVELCY